MPPKKRKLPAEGTPLIDGEKKARVGSGEPGDRKTSVDDDGEDFTVPSDTEAAISLLRAAFFPSPLECPVMLVHQLYSVVGDRTAVDEELDKMKSKNLRILKLISLQDTYGLVFLDDLLARIRNAALALPNDEPLAERRTLLSRFANFINTHYDWGISSAALKLALSFQPGASSSSSSSSASSSSGSGSGMDTKEGSGTGEEGVGTMDPFAAAAFGELKTLQGEAGVTFLIHTGFLLAGPGDSLLLTVPECGAVIRDIMAGRKEITQILKRRTHKEMLLNELLQKKLKSSRRTLKFHLRDMLGKRLLAKF